jgi:glycosyltransferase involved in cell wall biosynthesis
MMPQKGWRILVDAAQTLRQKGCDICVVLAGRGEDASEAQKLAESSGGWLQFKGFVANPRETLMTRLDALVLMSEQEGLPMAILEALSLGLPVVATPVGGVSEAVTDGENGFLVARSVTALAGALERLITSPELQKKMSAAARQSFERKFEIRGVVEKYDRFYQAEQTP